MEGFKHVTLVELKELALAAKADLQAAAKSVGRDIKLYLHWSAGHYGSFFDDYHINIDADGNVYTSTDDLAELKAHTWHRNTGAIGISLACCYQATSNNLGPEPPTKLQIEAMAQVVSVLCSALGISIDTEHVMTHGEAADIDGYGINSGDPETRWDLLFLKNGDKWYSGGEILRGKAVFYQQTIKI
ncbi:MAG: N-acetylmuramoyl-L-alanine amidase family 2 [Firmicutes bacterium]|nr:N-acetylmuramoyl-L-alanine amidase family 2 [Bacillota bacterium]